MSPYDTPQTASLKASAESHPVIIAQTRDLILQACGLGSRPSASCCTQSQQGAALPRKRGRPLQVGWTQLWSSLLLCALQGMQSFEDWRRLLGVQSIGSFAPVWLTRNGLVKRLLQAGLLPVQDLWEALNMHLASSGSGAVPATLATFATQIFCLDETRLDMVGRYLKPLRGLSGHDPACCAGKLVALLDVRAQRWLRLEWREAAHENCKVDILDFLLGLAQGSLVLFDLGYFSFNFFDTLSARKLWWVSRYREKTCYQIAHVFYRHHEVLDALVCLGTGQTQARHLVRLVRLSDGVGRRMYVTKGGDPHLLSVAEVAHLYARRWAIELAFRLLKDYLGMSHWWSRKQELILVQIWVVLILSHLVYALRERVATAASCESCEVSVPLLVELLPKLCSPSDLQLEQLIHEARARGLVRASPRLALSLPLIDLLCYQPAPLALLTQRPGRTPPPPQAPRPKPTTRTCGYQMQQQRRQASKEARALRAAQVKDIKRAHPQPPVSVQLLI